MKFYDRPDCLNLSPYIDNYGTTSGIFVFKKFIDKDLVADIEHFLNTEQTEILNNPLNLIDWYEDRSSPLPPKLIEVWESISELIGPDWVVHPSASILKSRPGDRGMFVHSDSPGKGQCHLLSQTDTYKTCCELDYGVVAYFGDFEGGEIFYPDINPDGTKKNEWQLIDKEAPSLEYKPEKGDVVIHCAFDPYSHGVRDVISGTRYAYSNFSLKAIDNPGTFYNYGTKEYYEAVGNKNKESILKWLKPLKENPQFTKQAVKEMQESGLKGPELAATFFSDLHE
jgi:hypothetical protein